MTEDTATDTLTRPPEGLSEAPAEPDDAEVARAALARLAGRERQAVRRYVLAQDAEQRAKRRATRTTETPDLTNAALRLVRNVGRRAREDVDALPELQRIAQLADAELGAAARACVTGELAPWSWSDVGRVLGTSKQNAHRKYAGE
jgi:hypothetical protein